MDPLTGGSYRAHVICKVISDVRNVLDCNLFIWICSVRYLIFDDSSIFCTFLATQASDQWYECQDLHVTEVLPQVYNGTFACTICSELWLFGFFLHSPLCVVAIALHFNAIVCLLYSQLIGLSESLMMIYERHD